MILGSQKYLKKTLFQYNPTLITKESITPKIVSIDTFKVAQHKTQQQNKDRFKAPESQHHTDHEASKIYQLLQNQVEIICI